MFPLIAENLVVEFNGKHILGPLDLTVNKGDILLILGPNGSGKTTLLKSLHGIMKLKRGSIKWSCSDKSSMQKQMFVFQTPIMLRRSVLENLTYPLLLRKVSDSKAHRLATEWAEKIGLKEIMQISATRLSGGEKQRVAVARALINEPSIILADEPSGNLDTTSSNNLHELFLSLREDFNYTFIIATHDLSLAKKSDRILEIIDGRIK